MHISNVQLWSASESKGVRTRFDGDGRAKRRVSVKTGAAVGVKVGATAGKKAGGAAGKKK